jgi:branched-chain amino acid transport system substrate-binding protein
LGPEFVYFGGYHTEAGLMLRQAADQSYKLNLMTGDSIATSEFWQISGPAGEGTLFTFATDPRRSPNAAEALEQFKAQGFEPKVSLYSAMAWSRRSPRGSSAPALTIPKAIAKVLEDGKPVETVMGPVHFDSKGGVLDPSYDINVWSADRRFALTPPAEHPLYAVSLTKASMSASKAFGVSHCGVCPASGIICTARRHRVGIATESK